MSQHLPERSERRELQGFSGFLVTDDRSERARVPDQRGVKVGGAHLVDPNAGDEFVERR